MLHLDGGRNICYTYFQSSVTKFRLFYHSNYGTTLLRRGLRLFIDTAALANSLNTSPFICFFHENWLAKIRFSGKKKKNLLD
jgi:hypothetical protein